MATRYASLTGPLMGLYYPLPEDLTDIQCRVALSASKLKALWCSVYPEDKVDAMIAKYGGEKLPDRLVHSLDYDAYAVMNAPK